jgi:hypothetical protein
MIQQRGSIMPALLDFLYCEYCRVRLAEMRKQLFIRAESQEVPEANFDAGEADDDSDRGRGSGDWQREAGHRAPI